MEIKGFKRTNAVAVVTRAITTPAAALPVTIFRVESTRMAHGRLSRAAELLLTPHTSQSFFHEKHHAPPAAYLPFNNATDL
jgi:hypothetical protein